MNLRGHLCRCCRGRFPALSPRLCVSVSTVHLVALLCAVLILRLTRLPPDWTQSSSHHVPFGSPPPLSPFHRASHLRVPTSWRCCLTLPHGPGGSAGVLLSGCCWRCPWQCQPLFPFNRHLMSTCPQLAEVRKRYENQNTMQRVALVPEHHAARGRQSRRDCEGAVSGYEVVREGDCSPPWARS